MEGTQYNYYDILEINPHCSQIEISTAYQRAKATYARDNPAIYTIFSEDEARELLKLVEEAFSVLGNKALRSVYDEKLAQGIARLDNVNLETLQGLAKSQKLELPKKTPPLKFDHVINPNFESSLANVQDWTGEWIRKVREYKGVSIERLSEITKVSGYYLKAIESTDLDQLPAPVFVRGYVIQVSKVLGLPENKVADSYMKLFRQKIEQK